MLNSAQNTHNCIVQSKKRIKKWTLPLLLSKAYEIHGNKYNYSQINDEHIQGNQSKICVKCQICQYQWNPSIYGHINKKTGCPNCAGNAPWTLKRFLEKASLIHEDKYDYSQITEQNIKNNESKITIQCKHCDYQWNPSIQNHINHRQGCPNCAGNAPWTLKRFLDKAIAIHGDRNDYSQITESDIQNNESKITIQCNTCQYQWQPTIKHHINSQSGCPNCAGKTGWTLEKILTKAIIIHGDKYGYSKIQMDQIKGAFSHITVVCYHCDYQWKPTIASHIYGRKGCPNCAGNAPWTLKRFLEKASLIHEDKYDYSKISEAMIIKSQSQVPIQCQRCAYQWQPTIANHIYGQKGCPNCSKKIPWTLERFLKKSQEIHEDSYDYSMITESQIIGNKSKITIICRKCQCQWQSSIDSHVNGRRGCPQCNRSHGELVCQKVLRDLNIQYEIEHQITSYDLKRFDLMFCYRNKKYLIEFDGIQHFKYIPYFHRNQEHFEMKRMTDVLKTQLAIANQYYLIRIDYTQIDNIKQHIETALSILSHNHLVYYSNDEMYQYIINVLLKKYKIKLKENNALTGNN